LSGDDLVSDIAVFVLKRDVKLQPTNRNDDCLEDKREDYQNCSLLLCMTVVHNDTHTREQFLKLSIGLGLAFCVFKFRFFVCLWAIVCKTVHPMLSIRYLSVLSVTFVHCGQTVGWIKMKLGTQVGLGPGHIVLGGTELSSPKGAQALPM